MFFPPDEPVDDNNLYSVEERPWWTPPRDELPALFPISELLAVTPEVAVMVLGARVYSVGVEFLIERRIRRGDKTAREWQIAQMGYHGSFGLNDPDRLRWGVALADGAKLVLDQPWGRTSDGTDTPERALTQTGGSGSGSEDFYKFEDGLWLWPLPPEGPLELVVQWPAMNVAESRVVIDGGALRKAAEGARRVWE